MVCGMTSQWLFWGYLPAIGHWAVLVQVFGFCGRLRFFCRRVAGVLPALCGRGHLQHALTGPSQSLGRTSAGGFVWQATCSCLAHKIHLLPANRAIPSVFVVHLETREMQSKDQTTNHSLLFEGAGMYINPLLCLGMWAWSICSRCGNNPHMHAPQRAAQPPTCDRQPCIQAANVKFDEGQLVGENCACRSEGVDPQTQPKIKPGWIIVCQVPSRGAPSPNHQQANLAPISSCLSNHLCE